MDVARPFRALGNFGRLAKAILNEYWTTRTLFIPVGKSFQANPYPLYHRLRKRDPIHWSAGAGGWILTRHRDAKSVLGDARFSSDPRNYRGWKQRLEENVRLGLTDRNEPLALTMLTSDPPDHTRLRNLVSKAFTPRAIANLQTRIEALVSQALDETEKLGEMELVRDLAVPLPVSVIAQMLGIPSADHERFKAWSRDFAGALGRFEIENARRARRSAIEFNAYISKIADARRREPREDLLSALVAAEADGDRLQPEELASTCQLILTAGNETTTNAIANGILALLQNPGQHEFLRSEPAAIDVALEELLRYDSPVQGASRNALEDLEFEGHQIRKGDQVFLLIGAVNRDPDVFSDPDQLDLQRAENPHLAFGFGRHLCLGHGLARLEAKVVIAELVRRFPNLRLAHENIERNGHIVLRGVKELPLRLN